MKTNKFIALVIAILVVVGVFTITRINVDAATEEPDWKTCISLDQFTLNDIFLEYEESKTLYTTTGVNLRTYPNTTDDNNVVKVLSRNTEVTAVAEYNGWTKVIDICENGMERTCYIWNKYLSEEKQNDTYLGTFKLTAYCNCSSCCGKWAGGPTASGAMPSVGRTVAMAGVPFGTKLLINGNVYTVEDRGTPYGHVDIYHGSHGEASSFGVRYADVYQID